MADEFCFLLLIRRSGVSFLCGRCAHVGVNEIDPEQPERSARNSEPAEYKVVRE